MDKQIKRLIQETGLYEVLQTFVLRMLEKNLIEARELYGTELAETASGMGCIDKKVTAFQDLIAMVNDDQHKISLEGLLVLKKCLDLED